VPVAPGSPLAGAEVAGAARSGRVKVIGLIRFGEGRPHWNPPGTLRIDARDRLLVVARRSGLNWLLDRAAAPETAAPPLPGKPSALPGKPSGVPGTPPVPRTPPAVS